MERPTAASAGNTNTRCQWPRRWDGATCDGSDYPHFEGTFGHRPETLHGLFDDVDDIVSHRIRIGTFEEPFPHVPPLPTAARAPSAYG
jgi:hypothetical protein